MVSQVQEQYESWPYPRMPRVAAVPREHLWQIHLNWIRSRCGVAPLDTQSHIWIAGCGTFEPYLFSRANPGSQILATDISRSSLDVARKRLSWHRAKNVQLAQIDLNQTDTFPDATFDFIECYGVLMCLPDPLKTLKALANRLKPGGILRIMVYPHYSRQRIFQIQKLAKLLGLSFQKQNHPALLKSLITKLPRSHPLSYAFFSYWDSKNLPGIVDAFLHASDRGFTGIELMNLVDEAGLTPRFCFHRPWGQPSIMSEKLSALGSFPFAFWLHYLDLWQSLRTNFTLCLVKKEESFESGFSTKKHPLFDLNNSFLSPLYRAKLVGLSLKGVQLPSRTAENPINLSPNQMKRLLKGQASAKSLESEILLNPPSLREDRSFDDSYKGIKPKNHFQFRDTQKILNPLYDYLFDAYTFNEQNRSILGTHFPNLSNQIEIWKNEAFPLEDELHPFGLTPFGTYLNKSKEISEFFESYLEAPEVSFAEFRLPNERSAFHQVHQFLKSVGIQRLPEESEATVRQLWILLFSYDKLFLET